MAWTDREVGDELLVCEDLEKGKTLKETVKESLDYWTCKDIARYVLIGKPRVRLNKKFFDGAPCLTLPVRLEPLEEKVQVEFE